MKINRVVAVLFVCTLGCTKQNGNTPENGSSGGGSNPRTKHITEACITSPCEGEVFMKKLDLPNGPNPQGWRKTPLRAEEVNSLQRALTDTQTTGAEDKLHVHADVVDGRLLFRADQDHDEHVSGVEPEVSLGNQNPATTSKPVKIVATPAALKLLQKRAQSPH